MKPTSDDLYNEEGFEEVHREADDSWRHGSYVFQVFKRLSDDTYWGAAYCLSTDGEAHGLREGDADISEVEPKEVTTVTYVTKKG